MYQPTTTSVWEHLSGDLRRFIRRRVADEHVADDLLQETFMRIHRSIKSLTEADRLAAWVYRIARNVVADHHRKSKRAAVASLESEPADPCNSGRSALPAGAEVWIDEFIRQLPPTYQEAVRLSEIEGLPQQEVADRLGLTLSGAKSRIQRGRGLLRAELERCCSFEFDRRGNLTDCVPKPDRSVCLDCEDIGLT